MENSTEDYSKTKSRNIYDPAIPLLGIYPKKMKTLILKDTCTSISITQLFTIAKLWKQPKCPAMDKWLKKMWFIYTMAYYLAIKNFLPLTTMWMDLQGILLSEISQRKTNILCYSLCD